jgi:hypothetical protein
MTDSHADNSPDKKIAPHEAGPISISSSAENNNKAPKKWRRMLKVLADGAALTRFDAERHGDHALNSTISDLRRKGIDVSREPITIVGRFGVIHCKRYWLTDTEAAKARALIGGGQ